MTNHSGQRGDSSQSMSELDSRAVYAGRPPDYPVIKYFVVSAHCLPYDNKCAKEHSKIRSMSVAGIL